MPDSLRPAEDVGFFVCLFLFVFYSEGALFWLTCKNEQTGEDREDACL